MPERDTIELMSAQATLPPTSGTALADVRKVCRCCVDHRRLFRLLGPGIMFASTAVGVSHLVQCTRSGARYGWANAWAIIASNVFKYPFFEFASRYANATGGSLVDGYRSLGRPVIVSVTAYMVASSPIITAAVGVTTGAFIDNLFSLGSDGLWGPGSTVGVLYTGCALVLLSGRFSLLDGLIKAITALLVVCTLAALVAAMVRPRASVAPESARANGTVVAPPPDPWDASGIRFLVALMGWMPVPMDTGSIASSLWSVERYKSTGLHPTLRETLAEFAFGYILTALLALAFLSLGVLLLHDSGEELPHGSAALASAVVELYSQSLGAWAAPVVGTAASCAMLGTCITILDAYARILSKALQVVFGRNASEERTERLTSAATLLYVALASYILLMLFPGSLRALVDLATSLSFVIAPAVGAANLRLVVRDDFPRRCRPPPWLRALAWSGLVFLVGFCALYARTLFVSY
eukprot:7391475-Prymnesium_polylepis.1